MCVGKRGGGGGGGKERETNLFRRDNPSCYPQAEVETIPTGFFLPNFICVLLISNI